MRNTRAASLLLSPMLLIASAVASPTKNDVSSDPQPNAAGVVAPQLIRSNVIHVSSMDLAGQDATSVVLALTVDQKGNAENIRVIRSASPVLDAVVVSEISRAQFRPGKFYNRVVPVDVQLKIQVQR